MKTLLDDLYAPITSSVGFLRVPLSEAAAALGEWRRSLYSSVTSGAVACGFPEALHGLEPLTLGAAPRELLVEHGSWQALSS